MLPTDSRSPFRNQRWIECVGSALAFGDCVLITDSIRAETDGIRTIFEVTTPNKDSQPNTIIIGHLEGSQGYCTNDFPTYAKCDPAAIPGDMVGPVAGSRVLSKNAHGYLVMGDVQGGLARVRRLDCCESLATIVGTLLTDRTREIIGGLTIGRANVLITGKVGAAGDPIGATVPVFFGDARWLESVKGCKVIADYIYDAVLAADFGLEQPWFWIVKECQGLAAGMWCRTQESRSAGAPDQDVLVTVIQQTGHANDDFPPELWGGQPTDGQPGTCSGTSFWTWNPFSIPRGWDLHANYCSEGCTPVPPANDPPNPDVASSAQGGCSATGQPPTDRQLKVRFLAGTFPRMRSGAMVKVSLENDITNETSNTGMKYIVDYSQEMADEISGILSEATCGEDFTVTGIQVDSDWPHDQAPPSPQTILNTRFKWAGRVGDSWSAEWSKAEQAYVCDDATKHPVVVSKVTDTTDENGCRTIAWSHQQIWTNICAAAEQGGSLEMKLRTIDSLSSVTVDKGQSGTGTGIQCDPKLVLGITSTQVWAVCGVQTPGTIEVPLALETVVRTITGADGCLYEVYVELIVFGVCGDDVPAEDPLLCVAPWQCPTGTGSGSP